MINGLWAGDADVSLFSYSEEHGLSRSLRVFSFKNRASPKPAGDCLRVRFVRVSDRTRNYRAGRPDPMDLLLVSSRKDRV